MSSKPRIHFIRESELSDLCNVFVLAKTDSDRVFVRIQPGHRPSWITRVLPNSYNNDWHIALLGDHSLFRIATSNHPQHETTSERFIAYLKETHPKDLEWLLWHPEVFNGKFNE